MISNRLRKTGAGILVSLFTVVLLLVAAELVFRAFLPQPLITVAVQEWDSRLGYKQSPGARGCLRTPEFDCPVQINSKGLRDREYDYRKANDTLRILSLGDSFTFGYGVTSDESFSKVLERLLNEDGARLVRWEVINAGVCGTGLAHQLAYYEDEGSRYDPDITLVCICGANEFSDNSMSGLYTVDGDTLVRHEACLALPMKLRNVMMNLPGYRTLFARSHLITYIKRSVARYAYARGAGADKDSAEIAAGRRRSLELAERLLLDLNERCRANGARLVVTVVPRPDDSDQPDRVAALIRFARQRGIAYADLAPGFTREHLEGHITHFPHDGHWNVTGHALAAQLLYEALRDSAWIGTF